MNQNCTVLKTSPESPILRVAKSPLFNMCDLLFDARFLTYVIILHILVFNVLTWCIYLTKSCVSSN